MCHTGFAAEAGCQRSPGPIGKKKIEAANSSAVCTDAWVISLSCAKRRAYRYPKRSATWKKTRQVDQTAAEPPNQGRMRFATSGSRENRRNALRKIVDPKSRSK